MNLLGPDHRTSHAAVQSLARLAAGRVSRLNKDIFLLIRPSVVCPPRRRCTCSSQCLMYVFSSSSIRSVSQLSLTVFLLLHMTPPTLTPHHHLTPRLLSPPSSQLLIISWRREQIYHNFISRSQSLAHVLPHSGCTDNHSVLLLLYKHVSLPDLCPVYAPVLAVLVSRPFVIFVACTYGHRIKYCCVLQFPLIFVKCKLNYSTHVC